MAWEHAFHRQIFELSLSEDVEDLRLERSIQHSKVSKEEIDALTIDENLQPLERVIHILQSGQEIQKVSILHCLCGLVKNDDSIDLYEILPVMVHTLGMKLKDISVACAKCLLEFIEGKIIDVDTLLGYFLEHTLLELMQKDEDICDSWLEVLISVLKSKGELSESVEHQIVTYLQSNSSLAHGSLQRKICCRIVAYLSKSVEISKFTHILLPMVKSFCQDVDLEVRACMCLHLEYIIDSFNFDITQQHILPELRTCLKDEEITVRQAALTTITNLLVEKKVKTELLIDAELVDMVISFYKKTLVRKVSVELNGAAKMIGKIFYTMSDVFTEEQCSVMLDCFQVLCSHSNEAHCVTDPSSVSLLNQIKKRAECRYWCAYYFLCISECVTLESFRNILLPCLSYLIKDSHIPVRKAIAFSVHKVAILLKKDVFLINSTVLYCLKDSEVEVLEALLPTIPQLIACFSVNLSQSVVNDLIAALLASEEIIGRSLNWRAYESYLNAISCLHLYVPDLIVSKLVPSLFKTLTENRFLPVKMAAGRTLLTFIKYSKKEDEKQELCDRMIANLARSESSKHRILFISLLRVVAEMFSRRFFKIRFYESAMELATDPIINVRLKFCASLPLLKAQLHLPQDRMLVQTLELNVRRIMALENDKDISELIRTVVHELDNVIMSMEGVTDTEDDIADRKKEKFEQEIIEDHHNSPHRGRAGSMGKEQCKRGTSISKSSKSTPSVSTSKKIGIKAKESTSEKSCAQSTSGFKTPPKKSSSHSSASKKK